MSDTRPFALVAGAGLGLGRSLLDRFSAGGYESIGLSRSVSAQIIDIHKLDLSDAKATQSKITNLIKEYGAPKVVIHNPSQLVIQPFMQTTQEEFEMCWRSMVQSAVTLAQSTFMPMVRAGGGTFIISGATASLRGGVNFAAFASAKFALRGLAQSLAREYQSAGIHVVHVILDGIIDTAASRDLHDLDPSRMMHPEDIAENYWQLAHQPQSTWSHEVDLRPATEKF